MLERGLKRLPVLDADGRLVGMLSRLDLLRALGESYPAPDDAGKASGAPVVVGDVMSRHVPVVRQEARLAEVLDVVVSTRLNRAVVIDGAGRVQGVISDADVLHRLESHAHPGVLGTLMRHSRMVPDEAARTTAAEMMRAPALTVTPDTPIREAARRMVDERRKILPVVDASGVLVGIVDRAHLLTAAGRQDADLR
jgi:CBS domain-containing protein